MRKTESYTPKQAAIKSGIPEDEIMIGILTGDIPAKRENGQFHIPQNKVRGIPGIIDSLRPLYSENEPKKGDKQFWVWHYSEGEFYTPVMARDEAEARKKFRKINKAAIVAVWAV